MIDSAEFKEYSERNVIRESAMENENQVTNQPPMPSAQQALPKKSSNKALFIVLAAVGAFIFLCIGFAVVVVLIVSSKNSGSTAKEQVSSILSSTEFKSYSSPEYGFTINFPGFPEIERKSIPVGDYNIPYALYTKSITDNDVYMVGVFDYTSVTTDKSQLSLEGAMNGNIQNIPGAVLVDSQNTSVDGNEAIYSHFTAPIEGTTYDGYMTVIMGKTAKMFMVETIGAPKLDYEKFVDSFSLN